uniref:Envelope protein n=1 Tax=Strix occidentalis caurina TaxID=311401 RepID=A0A8D0KPN1_STROC
QKQKVLPMPFLREIRRLVTPSSGSYEHQPWEWMLIRWEDQKILQRIVTPGPPSFYVKICDLVVLDPCPGYASYYMCPSSNPGRSYCNAPNQYYCAYWGCETIASDWKPGAGRDKYLKVHGSKNWCDYLVLNVTNENDLGWTIGKTWGFRHWESGADRGGLIFIKKQEVKNSIPIGPNTAIKSDNRQRKESLPISTPVLTSSLPTRQISPTNEPNINLQYLPDKPFFNVLDATFSSLNQSNPNLKSSCWLCYDVYPPFYEGVALNASFSYSSENNPAQCKWNTPRRGITLSQVRGRGVCFGNTSLTNWGNVVCAKTAMVNRTYKWAIPPASGMWVCHKSGVNPCVSLELFSDSADFCVLIVIVPRVLYHSEEEMYHHWGENDNRLQKREVITAVTIAMLLGLGVAGTATGVTSLVNQQRGLSQLQAAIDEDLQKIEKSVTFLEQSLSSLSEVVLQNRRGLDLLFLQQGGLCVALKEECCFYADHTGVVRDTMAELRERLAKRKRDREAQQGWFESWFNHSPWLTTLVSTLMGPIVMILLALIFGPCILNKFVSFVKSRLEKVDIICHNFIMVSLCLV